MKRRILTMLLAVCILAGMLAVPVAAKTRTTIEQMADSLYEAKLFLGAGTNDRGEPQYQLGQTATRVQAVTMLVRILGKEAEAKQNAASYKTPFTDVPKWADKYVAYAYEKTLPMPSRMRLRSRRVSGRRRSWARRRFSRARTWCCSAVTRCCANVRIPVRRWASGWAWQRKRLRS